MADENSKVSEGQPISIEARVSSLETKFEMFIGEMRDRDNQRAEDIREIRSSIETMNTKIDSMTKSVSNITIAAIVGIGAISVSVVGFVFSVIFK